MSETQITQTTPDDPIPESAATVGPRTAHAIAVLRAEATCQDTAIEVRGAWNDYNSRGRGCTTARRVLRDGTWQWVSRPASRGRYLAGDRHDVQHGAVYEGEIVATYTLGRDGALDTMHLVRAISAPDQKPLQPLPHVRIKGGYRLNLPDGTTLDVSDPTWR